MVFPSASGLLPQHDTRLRSLVPIHFCEWPTHSIFWIGYLSPYTFVSKTFLKLFVSPCPTNLVYIRLCCSTDLEKSFTAMSDSTEPEEPSCVMVQLLTWFEAGVCCTCKEAVYWKVELFHCRKWGGGGETLKMYAIRSLLLFVCF